MSSFPATALPAQALADFRAVCLREHQEADPDKKIDAGDELDWFALSIGYFLAKGLSPEDAHALARQARYDHHYWT